jgi:hypothetical protein
VDRQAGARDFHRHDSRVAVALDRGDLTHRHTGDAHRGFRGYVHRGGELGLQAKAVLARDVLGEAEVQDDRQQHDRDQAEAHRV